MFHNSSSDSSSKCMTNDRFILIHSIVSSYTETLTFIYQLWKESPVSTLCNSQRQGCNFSDTGKSSETFGLLFLYSILI